MREAFFMLVLISGLLLISVVSDFFESLVGIVLGDCRHERLPFLVEHGLSL